MNKDKKLKIGILSFLTTAFLYNATKNFIFGNPPNKIRKGLFYTSLFGLIMYNSCGDKIDSLINKSYTSIYGIVNNPVRQENILLEDEVNKLHLHLRNLEASLQNGYVAKLKNSSKNNKTSFDKNKFDKRKSKYWYVVKEHDSIEELSKKYLGNENESKNLKKFNRYVSERKLPQGFPLRFPDGELVSVNGLRSDDYPDNIYYISKGNSLNGVIDEIFHFYNLDDKLSKKKIIEYVKMFNKERGNIIPENNFSSRDGVVYMPFNVLGN